MCAESARTVLTFFPAPLERCAKAAGGKSVTVMSCVDGGLTSPPGLVRSWSALTCDKTALVDAAMPVCVPRILGAFARINRSCSEALPSDNEVIWSYCARKMRHDPKRGGQFASNWASVHGEPLDTVKHAYLAYCPRPCARICFLSVEASRENAEIRQMAPRLAQVSVCSSTRYCADRSKRQRRGPFLTRLAGPLWVEACVRWLGKHEITADHALLLWLCGPAWAPFCQSDRGKDHKRKGSKLYRALHAARLEAPVVA
jgi:hypothetical protein